MWMCTLREGASVPDGSSITLSSMNHEESKTSQLRFKTDKFKRIREAHPVLEAMQDLNKIKGKRIYPRKILKMSWRPH
jgi:hypothetical protein